MTIMNKQLCID